MKFSSKLFLIAVITLSLVTGTFVVNAAEEKPVQLANLLILGAGKATVASGGSSPPGATFYLFLPSSTDKLLLPSSTDALLKVH